MIIDLDPEIAAIFKASSSVSGKWPAIYVIFVDANF